MNVEPNIHAAFRRVALAAIIASVATTSTSAGNLLDDPGFELATDGTQTSNSAWVLDVNVPDLVHAAAEFETAAWASNPGGTPGTGVWLRSFEGMQAPGEDPARARLTQDVPGMSGVMYELTAWYKVETHHQLSAMLLGIEFLDDTSTPISGTAQDIYPAHPRDGSWMPAMVSAVSPPGTVAVRVYAEMIDGSVAPANPQSAFLDDFQLIGSPSTPVLETSWTGIKTAIR